MATSVNLGFCPWLAGATFNDQIGRLDVNATTLFGSVGGVLQSVNQPLQVLAVSGMNISVGIGGAVIPSSSGSGNGSYRLWNPAVQTLTVATAPGSPNTRIDLVVAQVTDNGNNTSFSQVELVTGTPANPGVAPATPTNCVVLAQIAVGSSVSSITQGNITDQRTYVVGAGGIPNHPIASGGNGYNGLIAFDAATSRFYHWSASGVSPMKLMPFQPGHVQVASNVVCTGFTGGAGTPTTIASTNLTLDGSTDVQIIAHWNGFYMNPSVTLTQILATLWIDSTQLDETIILHGANATTLAYNGGTIVYFTSSATADTPSAGAHTFKWQVLPHQQSVATPVTLQVQSGAGRNAFFRVQPVTG